MRGEVTERRSCCRGHWSLADHRRSWSTRSWEMSPAAPVAPNEKVALMSSDAAPNRPGGRPAAIELTVAWVSAVLVPVGIVVGRAASNAFLEARGYPQPVSSEPPGVGFAAFALLAVIVLIPTISAVCFGLHASRAGRRSGLGAASIGGVIGGGLVLFGLPLFLSRLIGWPLVVVIGAVLAAAAGPRVVPLPTAIARGPPSTPPQRAGGFEEEDQESEKWT